MPAIDRHINQESDLESPITHGHVVVPDDGNDLPWVTTCIYVGVAGDVTCRLYGSATHDADITFKELCVGWHPIRTARILAAGTTATDMVACW